MQSSTRSLRRGWLALAATLALSLGTTGHLAAQDPSGSPPPPFAVVGASFFAVQVADIESATAWYTAVFGLVQVHRIDAEDGRFHIRLLAGERLNLEIIQARGTEAPPQRHHGWFKAGVFVDDIEAAHAWISAQSDGTDERIFYDQKLKARSFVSRDPFGNRIQLFARCETDCEPD